MDVFGAIKSSNRADSVGWVRTDVPLAHPQLHPHQACPGTHPVLDQSWEPAGNGEGGWWGETKS